MGTVTYYLVVTTLAPESASEPAIPASYCTSSLQLVFLFSISMFSFINCNTVMECTPRMRSNHRLLIVLLTNTGTFLIYFAFCILLLFFSRRNPTTSIWRDFTGVGNGWETSAPPPWWAAAIRVVILLLPPVTTLSVFPNMISFHTQSVAHFFHLQTFFQRHPHLFVCFRSALCLTPVLLCVFYDVTVKLVFVVGAFATAMMVGLPALIQSGSIRHIRRMFGDGFHRSLYTLPCISSAWAARTLFVVAVVLVLVQFSAFVFSYVIDYVC